MSEKWTELHNIDLYGGWWMLSATFGAIYHYPAPHPPRGDGALKGQVTGTEAMWILTNTERQEDIGIISFSRGGETTHVRIAGLPQYRDYWAEVERVLETVARFAEQFRAVNYRSAEDAIEHYYRSRAAGSKMTLKELAATTGFNYTYLSQVKARYDREGKWGSKPRRKPKTPKDREAD